MNEDPAVTNFRNYLKIRTVQPNPDYGAAKEFLKKQAESLSLLFKVITVKSADKSNEIIIMTWPGTDSSLSSIVLNSHIDVVPVFPEHWKYEPFSAHKDENGDIYARGTQDMKCVGIQYLEAIRKLKSAGKQFLRTIHLSFVPDEEIGGADGMELFIKTKEFQELNIGFALDEGLANPSDAFTLFYGERSPWWIEVTCKGDPGHGSRFVKNSAAEKFRKVMNSIMTFRDEEEARLMSDPNLKLGDVTTVNMTILQGGVQPNVIPTEYKAVFDFRISPIVNTTEFEQKIDNWCMEAGPGVSKKFIVKHTGNNITELNQGNPWWTAFKAATDSMSLKLEYEIFSAATDSRFLRKMGYPVLGFSPMNHTPILLHDHNEYLNEKIFLRGIDIYCQIIPNIASISTLEK